MIDASPTEVCAGDAYTTPIALSGARSAERLSLVPAPPAPGATPLVYEWTIEGDAHVIVSGALDAPELTLRMAGERPLHATLTVTNAEGGVAETLRTIGITFAEAPPCDDGCEDGTSCVQRDGESVCLPDGECASDEDCDACFVCDVELARCVPGDAP